MAYALLPGYWLDKLQGESAIIFSKVRIFWKSNPRLNLPVHLGYVGGRDSFDLKAAPLSSITLAGR